MTRHGDKNAIMPDRRICKLLVILVFSVALLAVVVSCSTEARYKIKTVIFTGVPPLPGQTATDEVDPAQANQSALDEQKARQEQHREALVSKYWQHAPYAKGECGSCHDLAQSGSFGENRDSTSQAPAARKSVSVSSRLMLPTRELCVSCHTQHRAEFARSAGLQQHLPDAAGFCTSCHNPHQSLRQYLLLKADNSELCGGCHAPATMSAVHTEDPQQDCMDCHNAHVGVTKKLLRADGQEPAIYYGGSTGE